VLATRVYKKQLHVLDGRGVLFAVADDVKILGPPEVIKEMARDFPTLEWEEVGLTTKRSRTVSSSSPLLKPAGATSSP
jgi:hypothetical protein